jgi:hypothetical protein
MPTDFENVCLSVKNGSNRPNVKTALLTHNALAPASLKIEYSARLRVDAFGLCNQMKAPETLPPAKTATT